MSPLSHLVFTRFIVAFAFSLSESLEQVKRSKGTGDVTGLKFESSSTTQSPFRTQLDLKIAR